MSPGSRGSGPQRRLARPVAAGACFVLLGAVGVTGAVAATAVDPAGSVRDIDAAAAVRDIDLGEAVVELRTEERTGTEVVVTINADVLFDFDRADLTEVARREIARLVEQIGAATGPVRVDGHTDSIGDENYNLDLSQRRADAVAGLLRSSLGPGAEVVATGHGEADPVAENIHPDGSDNPAGRALNRRVTITYRAG